MLRIVLLLVSCGFFATPLFAQENLVDEQTAVMLIRQLKSRDAAKRDDAERKLRAAGTQVLDFLPPISDRTSGELKVRLLRIRNHLERQRSAETARATHVTLQGEMTLSEALASIKRQTNNVVIDYRERLNQPADDTKIALAIDDEPFWQAFDKLADEANIAVYPYVGESRKLAIIAATESAIPRVGRADYEGLFRIEPTALSCQRNLRDTSGDILRLTVELLWEPRVLPILIRQDLSDIQVTTDTNETVTVMQTGMRQIPVQPGVASLDIQLPLALPERKATELQSLTGKFVALVPGGDVTFEFDDLVHGKGGAQTRGGLTVVLDDVRLNQGLQQVSLRIRFDEAADSLQSHLDWVENNVVKLMDPSGKPADEPGYERYLERDSEIGFRYIFPVEQKDLTGWKLVYTSPAGVAEVQVPFEISNIPLP